MLYCLSLYLYKRRKIESSTEAIAFPKLRSIFKYGVTACTMLFGGMYFGEVQNNSIGWIVFGYVIGAILGYLAAEMVLQKSWRVFGRVKGLAIYGAVVAILITVVQMLGIYENNVPEQDEVKSVILADTPHIYPGHENYGYNYTPSPIEGENNIEAVRKLHEQIVSDKKIDQFAGGEESIETAFFLYELKNGDKVVRQYEAL
jgi:ABC-2 type transport system permease protein